MLMNVHQNRGPVLLHLAPSLCLSYCSSALNLHDSLWTYTEIKQLFLSSSPFTTLMILLAYTSFARSIMEAHHKQAIPSIISSLVNIHLPAHLYIIPANSCGKRPTQSEYFPTPSPNQRLSFHSPAHYSHESFWISPKQSSSFLPSSLNEPHLFAYLPLTRANLYKVGHNKTPRSIRDSLSNANLPTHPFISWVDF